MIKTLKICGSALIPRTVENSIASYSEANIRNLLHAVKFSRNCIYASTTILVIAAASLLKTAAKSAANYACKGSIILSAGGALYSLFRLYQQSLMLQETNERSV